MPVVQLETTVDAQLMAVDRDAEFLSKTNPATFVADFSAQELETVAADTSYSKNCPTHRTCGAASPCIQTC